MTTTNITQPHSAKIYQFPLGGRASVGPRGRQIKPMDLRAQAVNTVADCDSWYHEAAIQDAKRSTEH